MTIIEIYEEGVVARHEIHAGDREAVAAEFRARCQQVTDDTLETRGATVRVSSKDQPAVEITGRYPDGVYDGTGGKYTLAFVYELTDNILPLMLEG